MAILEEESTFFCKKIFFCGTWGKSSLQLHAVMLRALNKTIEPKIRQNERERAASMHAAAKCIVGIR